MIHYTKEYIQSLLDKFMDGTTTLEEENILCQYFARCNDVPRDWEDYRQLFAELEAMKPQQERKNHRLWGVAVAAVVAVFLYVVMPSEHAEQQQTAGQQPQTPLTAKADTQHVMRPEPPNQEVIPDTAALIRQLDEQFPDRPKRRLRKPEPTVNDYAKNYAVLAAVKQEQQQADRQLEEVKQEIVRAQLTAAGFTAVTLEDGNIIYTNDPIEFLTYEE